MAVPSWAESGRVTLLLTDVQGSTRLWETEPEAMSSALPRHDELAEALITSHGGWLVKSKGEGDSLFAVFPSAPAALAAAVDVQTALLSEQWPTSRPVSVRMSIHTGDAELRSGDWYGPTVNRAARIRATAHGGQIVVSEAARVEAGDRLPAGCSLRDLGERRLKDLTQPERIWQVMHPNLPASFPPLAALDARPHNLPIQPTPFLGREEEVAAIRGLLRDDVARLVTLTGPGGVGKTRLSLQIAAECLDDFAHGVWFVPLAALSDPALVPSAIADALGVADGGGPVVDRVQAHLADQDLLLVLDNFEHLMGAATVVSDLLAGAANLKVLVSSREWLHLRAEHEVAIQPFDLDTAVELFADRASAAGAAVDLDDPAARSDVEAICNAVDRIALAVELVAARARLFTLAQLRGEVDRLLDVATDGPRDLPARQRTLRDTIAWSYQLLSDDEREVLRLLATFRGGGRLEAIAELAGEDRTAAIESLAAKSLVRLEPGADDAPRAVLLEAVRQFAAEVTDDVERDVLAQAHAAWHAGLARRAAGLLTGPDQGRWLSLLEDEHNNMRAALDLWADDARAISLAADLGRFWSVRGHWSEGRDLFRRVLSIAGGSDVDRAECLLGAGNLADLQGDADEASHLIDKAHAGFVAAKDLVGQGQCFNKRGDLARRAEEPDRAESLYETALDLFAAAGASREVAMVLTKRGNLRERQGDVEGARAAYEAARDLAHRAGDSLAQASLANNLGLLSFREGDLAGCRASLQAAASTYRELGAQSQLLAVLRNLGLVAERENDIAAGRAYLEEAVTLARQLGDNRRVAQNLLSLATIEVTAGGDGWRVPAREAEAVARAAGLSELALQAIDIQLDGSNMADDRIGVVDAIRRSLHASVEMGSTDGVANGLLNAAELALDSGDHLAAVQLTGAAERVRGGGEPHPLTQLVQTRATLGEVAYRQAFDEGGRWSDGEAVRRALQVTAGAPGT